MLDLPHHVNWLAILVADLVAFGVGAIWFMLIFNRTYVVALGREDMPPPPPSLLPILGPFLCQALIIVTSAILLRVVGVASYAGAAEFGAIVGIGYLLPVVVNIALNPNFPRPFLYSAMNAPYFILVSITSCLILFAMG